MSVVSKPQTLLSAYLGSLERRPILTKSCTSAACGFLSEIIATRISKLYPPPLSKKDSTNIPPVDLAIRYQKAFKLAGYGFCISAPLAHFLMEFIQKVFKGKTSSRAKILQILAVNLGLSPILQTFYICAMALIGGVTNPHQIFQIWRANFLKAMRLSWVTSTGGMIVAQRYLEPQLWVPFFTAISTFVGTIVNLQAKRKLAGIERMKREAEKSKGDDLESGLGAEKGGESDESVEVVEKEQA